MGDCRIRIIVAKSLFDLQPNDLTAYENDSHSSFRVTANQKSVSFVRMYSADTTVRELVDDNPLLKRLYFDDSISSDFALWDCTLNPPRDITSWPVQDFPDLQGVKSKTLHAADLFPSGTWMAIPKGMAPSAFSDYDSNADVDVQYNTSMGDNGNDQSMDTGRRVEFNDPSLRTSGATSNALLPSQVMESVSNRFAAEEREEEQRRLKNAANTNSRRGNLRRRGQTEIERAAKLEQRIARLEDSSKNKKQKKVSDQVLRMLVKSRATGDKNLKEKDRLYFQCLNLVDDSNEDPTNESSADAKSSKEYRYFSPQDTFAKIAGTFSNSRKHDKEFFSEVLCRLSVGTSEETSQELPVYGRFPVTMRVYEAQSKGYLSLSETVSNYFDDMLIVRWYRDREDATSLIQDVLLVGDESNPNDANDTDMPDKEMLTNGVTTPIDMDIDEEIDAEKNNGESTSTFQDVSLTNTIRELDEANKKGTKKSISAKKSAAALKVKQMKMKSKAKGNKKVKMEDRVFLEVVSISEIGKKPTCESYFLSKNDSIEKILLCIGTSPFSKSTANDWDFLVPQDDSSYRPIDVTSIRMKEAAEQDILKSFDRIILRPKAN